MICEKTKIALENLFASKGVEETIEPEPVQEVETAGENVDEKQQELPRPDGVIERDYSVHGYHLDAQVPPDLLIDAVKIVDEGEFFIESITGVDWIKENQLEIIYDFSRYDFDLCRVVIRTRIARDNPEIPTITTIYAGANWHERETRDFFGINFVGHPHLVPLLLPEDADFHPLLKDFKA
ncbi:NADH-quinone oxidoreductase subunit C [Desulforhopalus singaporensis]|uniref:NADH-quinone oxidoreductase subunit C n=1 Tax=Desulforhopalus singaporensis TaxID=91360 RepID=A0A1H0V595_9BACT|nr:NADH-quinone oxidoreductase subunit C [Desulforhopalus singaporensis]SDP73544.1 NADH-quinone oxidoreductase subunit C [Desulforhopalus singaporensis]